MLMSSIGLATEAIVINAMISARAATWNTLIQDFNNLITAVAACTPGDLKSRGLVVRRARALSCCCSYFVMVFDQLTPVEYAKLLESWNLCNRELYGTEWFITPKAHNKFMHCLNGNGDRVVDEFLPRYYLSRYFINDCAHIITTLYEHLAYDDDYLKALFEEMLIDIQIEPYDDEDEVFSFYESERDDHVLYCVQLCVELRSVARTAEEAVAWNRVMHALNGNIQVVEQDIRNFVVAYLAPISNYLVFANWFCFAFLYWNNYVATSCLIVAIFYYTCNVLNVFTLERLRVDLNVARQREIVLLNRYIEQGDYLNDHLGRVREVEALQHNAEMHALNGNSHYASDDDSYRRRYRAKLKTKLEKRQLWRVRLEEIPRERKQPLFFIDSELERRYSDCLLCLDGILWEVCYALVTHKPHYLLKDTLGQVMRKKQFLRYVDQLETMRLKLAEKPVEAKAQIGFGWIKDFAEKIYGLIRSIQNSAGMFIDAIAKSIWWTKFVSGCCSIVSFFSRLVAMVGGGVRTVAATLLSMAVDFGGLISDKLNCVLKQLFEKLSTFSPGFAAALSEDVGMPMPKLVDEDEPVEATAQVRSTIDENIFEAAASFIVGIFGGDSNQVLRDRADLISKTMGVALTTKNFVLMCRDIVIYIIGKYDQIVVGFDGTKLDPSVQTRLVEWMRAVPNLLDFPTTELNESRVQLVYGLKRELDILSTMVIESGEDLRNLLYVPSVINRVNAYYAEAQTYVKHSPTRTEPLGLLIEGLPGIGKSAMSSDAIISMINLAVGGSLPADMVHTRNPNDKWWDRMKTGCQALVYDEFKAGVDPLLREQMSLEMLGLISTATFPTPAANMSLKATHEFRGLIVAALCNKSSLVADKLQDSNALWRRLFIVKVSVDEENYDKQTNRCKSYSADYAHLYFTVFKRSEKGTEKGAYSEYIVLNKCGIKEFIAWGATEVRKNVRIAEKLMDKSFFRTFESSIYDKDIDPTDALHNMRAKFVNPSILSSDLNQEEVEAEPQMFSSLFAKKKQKEDVAVSSPSLTKIEADAEFIDYTNVLDTWYNMTGNPHMPISRPQVMMIYNEIRPAVGSNVVARIRTVERVMKMTGHDNSLTAADAQEKHFESGTDLLRRKFGEGWLLIKKNWKVLLGMAVAGLSVAFLFLIHQWFGDDSIEAHSEAKYPGGEVQASKPRRYVSNRLPATAVGQSSSSGKFSMNDGEVFIAHNGWTEATPQVAGSGVLNKVRKVRANYAYFEVSTTDGTSFDHAHCIALGVSLQWVLVVGHIIGTVNFALAHGASVMVRIKTSSGIEGECSWNELQVHAFRTRDALIDAALIKLPRRFGQFANIITHFPKSIKDNALQSVFNLVPDELMTGETFLISATDARIYDKRVNTRAPGAVYTTVNSVQAAGFDGEGMCGVMLVSLNSKVEWPIVGMLYSTVERSGGQTCLYALITQDELISVIGPGQESKVDEILTSDLIDANAQGVVFPSNSQFLGKILPEYKNSLPGKSKIVESLVYNSKLSRYAPAMLRPTRVDGKVVNPRLLCVAKWSSPIFEPKPTTRQFFMIALNNLKKKVLMVKPKMRRLQTLDEALNSSQLLDQRSINVAASLGTPAKYLFKGKGKSGAIYQNERQRYIATKEFTDYWLKIKRQLEKGIRPNIIFTQQLKDELRELLKVITGSTRQFTAGEVCECIASRIYFGDFNQVFREFLTTGFCVGVNLNGSDARAIFDKFLVCYEEPTYICVDSEKNDTMFRDIFFEGIQETYRDWYSKWYNPASAYYLESDELLDEDGLTLSGKDAYERGCKARDSTFETQRHPWTLYEDNLVEHMDRLPSGSGETINWNCEGNVLGCNTNILSLCYDNNYPSPQNFEDIASIATIGDDLLGSVNSAKVPFITVQSMAKANQTNFARTYTNNRKDGKPIQKIVLYPNGVDEHVTFMKRSFVNHDGVLMLPLKREVVEEIPMWVNDDGRSFEERTREVVEAAMREWFHYGPKEYKKQCDELNARLELVGCQPVNISYLHLLSDWSASH